MGKYFETGIGIATSGKAVEMGRKAALDALAQITLHLPSLVLLFVASDLDIPEVSAGAAEVLGECPIIGTSTAREIAGRLSAHSVVVVVLASPHLEIRVGLGRGVSQDFERATREALIQAKVLDYFRSDKPLHQTLYMSASSRPNASPVLLLLFSPGATKTQVSLSHDIHTMLRKGSANRIPIFGGSSADYFHFESNYQIVNGVVSQDSVALAFIETEILFGLGMAHGFVPTTKRALITDASNHIVRELDGRPAVEVCAELLNMPLKKLGDGAVWFSRFPFGATDIYGNSLLYVPERILKDGSIQFGPLMKNDQVVTVMRGTKRGIARAGWTAYSKAISSGGLKKPTLGLIFSCALRQKLIGEYESGQIEAICKKAKAPIAGFYTFGEQGASDDGLPVYANHSVSTLVFSDELNPFTALIRKGKKRYYEFSSKLDRKASQIKAIGRINQIIQNESSAEGLLRSAFREIASCLPWADCAIYLGPNQSHAYTLVTAGSKALFPDELHENILSADVSAVPLDSQGKRLGMLVLRPKPEGLTHNYEDMVMADTIAKLVASGIHRIELDRGLESRLLQLEILNQVGREVSHSLDTEFLLQHIVEHVRAALKLSMATLWVVDPSRGSVLKKGGDPKPEVLTNMRPLVSDQNLARWQIGHSQLIFSVDGSDVSTSIEKEGRLDHGFLSLPLIYKSQLRGVLNLFWNRKHKWSSESRYIEDNLEFLKNISVQLAIVIENQSLQKNTTLFKEIHHRVKNNLQNIASILRLQIRRLDRVSAAQALNDSIARIASIAEVHETLSQGDIEMVDLKRLLRTISKRFVSDCSAERSITVEVAGTDLLMRSREATFLALVVNELVQNAVHHGCGEKPQGKVSVRIDEHNRQISVTVHDDGPGLSHDFDLDRDGNLGLSIVKTLIRDELRGEFRIFGTEGTTACVSFPLPEN